MLYGSNFVREDKKSLEPTKINYSLSPVEITEIKEDRDDYLLLGNNFTDASRVFVKWSACCLGKKRVAVS